MRHAAMVRAPRPVLVFDPNFRPVERTRRRDAAASAWARLPVIWMGAGVVALAAGYATAVLNPPSFSASGLLVGFGPGQAAVADEMAMLRSTDVARGVVARLGAGRVAPDCLVDRMTAPGCAAASVKTALEVQRAESDGFGPAVQVTATHADEATALAIVDAAVAVDRSLWYRATPPDLAPPPEGQLALAQGSLSAMMAETAQIRAQSHITDINQDLSRVANDGDIITRRDNDIRLRQVASAAELQAMRAALQGAPATVLDSRQTSSGDAGVETRALLLNLQLQRAHMAQLYAADYPGLAELDKKIDTVQVAIKAQAKNPNSVIREIRNPTVADLTSRITGLTTEQAGLAQQRQELTRQAGVVAARETEVRRAEARLAELQQRQMAQEAVVRQLTLGLGNMPVPNTMGGDSLTERRLLQRPVAVPTPWTGWPTDVAAGGLAGVLYGAGIVSFRRRRAVAQGSRRVLDRFWAWQDVEPAAPFEQPAPLVLAPPTPPAAKPDLVEATLVLRMFPARREHGVKQLALESPITRHEA